MTPFSALTRLAAITALVLYFMSGRGANGCERLNDGDLIDEMLHLVAQHHPTLVAEHALMQAQRRQHRWTAQARVTYADQATTAEAGGVNTSITVAIPLFDRRHELARAKAKQQTAGVLQRVRHDFLTALSALCTAAANVRELDNQRAFYRDRLTYQQQRVDEGLADAVTLWQYVDKAQQAEHDYQRKKGELSATLTTTAREFGGTQWKNLQALLAETTN